VGFDLEDDAVAVGGRDRVFEGGAVAAGAHALVGVQGVEGFVARRVEVVEPVERERADAVGGAVPSEVVAERGAALGAVVEAEAAVEVVDGVVEG
jgi:hypothetical protein